MISTNIIFNIIFCVSPYLDLTRNPLESTACLPRALVCNYHSVREKNISWIQDLKNIFLFSWTVASPEMPGERRGEPWWWYSEGDNTPLLPTYKYYTQLFSTLIGSGPRMFCSHWLDMDHRVAMPGMLWPNRPGFIKLVSTFQTNLPIYWLWIFQVCWAEWWDHSFLQQAFRPTDDNWSESLNAWLKKFPE